MALEIIAVRMCMRFFFSMVGTSDFNHACTSTELDNYRSMLTNFYLHQ